MTCPFVYKTQQGNYIYTVSEAQGAIMSLSLKAEM